MLRKLALLAALSIVSGAVCAQTPRKPKAAPKPPVKPQNTTSGQGQLQGGDGVFKTIYTLNSGYNFTILSAAYTVDPYNSYSADIAANDEKFLVLTVAIKNANPEDAYFNSENASFTAVDEQGHNHDGSNYRLASLGVGGFGPTAKPGQGYGQDPVADALTVAIKVPAKAKITKLILNNGRKFVKDAKVVRYFIAGAAKKDRDGADGNPKNIIAPLPESLRDPADPSGAVALDQGIGKLGAFMPSGYASIRCDSVVTSTTEKLNDAAPEDGKQFVIATITAKNIYGKEITMFDLTNGEGVPELKDADGEKYSAVSDSGPRKAKRDEQADSNTKLAPGETYSYRFYFLIPKDAKPKSLLFGEPNGHHYLLDLASAK